MENLEQIVIETAERSKSNTHRIDRLEGISEAIHEQNASIKELVSEIKHTNEHVTDHEDRLAMLEGQPAERWNLMIRTMITAIISALAGGAIGAFITLL